MIIKTLIKFLTFQFILMTNIPNTSVRDSANDKDIMQNKTRPLERDEPLIKPYQPCAGWEVAYGNATTATMLWLLAEDHEEVEDTKDCIHALTNGINEHDIYLEGVQSGNKVPCQLFYSLPDIQGRVCTGWDNRIAIGEMNQILKSEDVNYRRMVKQRIMNAKDAYKNLKVSDKKFKKILKEKRKNFKNPDWVKQYELSLPPNMSADPPSLIASINWILSEKKKGKSFQEAFDSYKIHQPEGYRVTLGERIALENAYYRRQESLTRTISNHPSTRFGVFVTGKDHVIKTKATNTLNNGQEMIQDTLKKSEDEKPFAVLNRRR